MAKKKHEIIERTDEIIINGNKSHERWIDIYDAALRYSLGDQTHDKKRQGGWQKININRIYPALMQSVSMTANRDTDIRGVPISGADYAGADKWTGHLQWQYEEGIDVDNLRMQMALSGKIFGNYIARPYWDDKYQWDEDAKKWRGGAKVSIELPFFTVVDPNLRDNDIQKAEYVYVMKRRPLRDAIQMYPEFETELRRHADAEVDISGQELSLWDKAKRSLSAAILNGDKSRDTGPMRTSSQLLLDALIGEDDNWDNYQNENAPKYVTIYEIYLKDDSTTKKKTEEPLGVDEFPEGALVEKNGQYVMGDAKFFKENGIKGARKGQVVSVENGNWPTKVTEEWEEPKYPYGRLVIRVGDTQLNPKYKDERIPYKCGWPVLYGQNLPLPFSPHGLNDIEMAREPQDWLNAMASGLAGHTLSTAFPPVIIEEGTLQNDPENKNVAAEVRPGPGYFIKTSKDRSNGLQFRNPGQLSNDVMTFYNILNSHTDDVLGSQNVLKGKSSSGEQTSTEIATLDRNASQRLNLAGRLLDEFTVKLMNHVLEISKYHLQPGDTVKVLGERFAETIETEDGFQFTINQHEVELDEEDFDSDFTLELEVVEHTPFARESRKQDTSIALQSPMGQASPTIQKKFLRAYGFTESEISDIMDEFRGQLDAMTAAAEEQQQAEVAAKGVTNGEGDIDTL